MSPITSIDPVVLASKKYLTSYFVLFVHKSICKFILMDIREAWVVSQRKFYQLSCIYFKSKQPKAMQVRLIQNKIVATPVVEKGGRPLSMKAKVACLIK